MTCPRPRHCRLSGCWGPFRRTSSAFLCIVGPEGWLRSPQRVWRQKRQLSCRTSTLLSMFGICLEKSNAVDVFLVDIRMHTFKFQHLKNEKADPSRNAPCQCIWRWLRPCHPDGTVDPIQGPTPSRWYKEEKLVAWTKKQPFSQTTNKTGQSTWSCTFTSHPIKVTSILLLTSTIWVNYSIFLNWYVKHKSTHLIYFL